MQTMRGAIDDRATTKTATTRTIGCTTNAIYALSSHPYSIYKAEKIDRKKVCLSLRQSPPPIDHKIKACDVLITALFHVC